MTGYISWFYLSFFKSMTETWHLVKLRLFDHHLSFLVLVLLTLILKYVLSMTLRWDKAMWSNGNIFLWYIKFFIDGTTDPSIWPHCLFVQLDCHWQSTSSVSDGMYFHPCRAICSDMIQHYLKSIWACWTSALNVGMKDHFAIQLSDSETQEVLNLKN